MVQYNYVTNTTSKKKLCSFYEDRYRKKIQGSLPRIFSIRLIDNLFYFLQFNRYKKDNFFGHMVDIGCGIFMPPENHTWVNVGLDISFSALSKRNGNRIVGDAAFLPFLSNTVGFVSCIEVLEHLPDGEDVFAIMEIHRILKNGGIAIISTPNNSKETSFLFRWFNILFCDSGHFRTYTERMLFSLIKEQEFEIIKIGTCGFFLLSTLLLLERNSFLEKMVRNIKLNKKIKLKLFLFLAKILDIETQLMNIFFRGFRIVAIVKKISKHKKWNYQSC